MKGWSEVPIATLIGETMVQVDGMKKGAAEIKMTSASGRKFRFHHFQDYCESVLVEGVVGNPNDLVGRPLLVAREDQSAAESTPFGPDTDVGQWTFYNLATVAGYVTIRWLGDSNGYYSMDVYFEELV
jgi:hypothetical protein